MVQYPFGAFAPPSGDIVQSSINRQVTALGILEPRTLRRLQSERFGTLAVRLWPQAPRAIQEVVGFALLWHAHVAEAWNRLSAWEQVGQQRAILAVLDGTEPGSDTLLILAAELRTRLSDCGLPAAWQARFAAEVSRFLESLSWECMQRTIAVPPVASELLARREATAGLASLLELLALDPALRVSSAAWDDPQLQRIRTLAVQMQALVHDAHIAAAPSLLDSDLGQPGFSAEERLANAHACCLAEFQRLSQLCVQGHAAEPAVASYITALKTWLAGQLIWHAERHAAPIAA